MASEERAEEQALSERLTKYSDTIVTASVVGVVGLGFGVADADIRPSLERGRSIVFLIVVVISILFSGIVLLLRRWEVDLKSDLSEDAKSLRYGKYLHWARLGIVGVSSALAVVLVLAIG